jgi:hypothetical protein
MSTASRARLIALPVVAVVLVAVVLVVQVINGGGRFAPSASADPCAARVTTTPETLDALGQDLVLLGLDGAACRLGTSREALTLDLAQGGGDPTDAQVDALEAGLLDGIDRMDRDGTLPPASDLVDQALDATDLNSLVKLAIRALPDAVVDRALPTDEVLRQAVRNLDVRALLTDLDDADRLGSLVTRAIEAAVRETLTDQLRGLI